MLVERLIGGYRRQRLKNLGAPLGVKRAMQIVAKHTAWIVISLATGGTLIGAADIGGIKNSRHENTADARRVRGVRSGPFSRGKVISHSGRARLAVWWLCHHRQHPPVGNC